MSIFSKVKALVSKSKPVDSDDWKDFLNAPLYHNSTDVNVEDSPKDAFAANLNSHLLPDWIKNQSDLRDEGVVFGLSGVPTTEKVDLIKSAYKKLSVPFEKKIELLSEKIGVLNLKIEQIEQSKVESEKQKDFHLNYEYQPHQFYKLSVAILLMIGVFVGTFFLVDFALAAKIGTSHWFVSLGVFFAGLFGVYQKNNVFEKKESFNFWKLAEWYLVPFTTSIFIFIGSYEQLGWALSSALFAFTSAIFLILGKIFFTHLASWTEESRSFFQNRRNKKFLETKLDSVNEKSQSFIIAMDDIRAEKWSIIPELTAAESELAKINSERDEKISLFLSEYALAKTMKEKLDPFTIKRIIE